MRLETHAGEAAARARRGAGPRRRWGYRSRPAKVAGAVLVGLALLLAIGQLVLPGIATDRVRERVERYGSVRAVHVRAVPAVELLWGDADEIRVRAGALRISPRELVDLEQSLSGVASAEMTSPRLTLLLSSTAASGEIAMEDARLSKRGEILVMSGVVHARGVHLALPAGLQVDGLSAASGQPEVGVTGGAFGVHVSGRGIMTVREGALVVEPAALPFAGLTAVKLLSDPRIVVESVGASPQGDGFRISLRGRPAS